MMAKMTPTMGKTMRGRIQFFVLWLCGYVNRAWYPPLIGVLAALDNLVVIIPNDGILIASSLLTPKRWWVLALSVAVGSTLGALALAALVELQGLPWILDTYPWLVGNQIWDLSHQFFDQWGLLLVFGVAVTPIMQQPAVILASLANTPLDKLAAVIFAGRFIKFLLMAFLAAHAPRLLHKLWGLRGELEDAGVKIQERS